MKQTTFPTWLRLLLLVSVLLVAAHALAAGEIVPRYIIPGGGGTRLAAGNMMLHGALGQPVAGPVSASTYNLCSGFWCGGAKTGKVYLPLTIRRWPPFYILDDVSDVCPGYGPIELMPSQYRQKFDHTGDKDWYTFAARTGFYYVIQTSSLGPNADTTLALFGSNCGTLLAENDDIHYPDNIASRIDWRAPADNIYHIRVHDYYNHYGAGTDYTLTIQESQ
jgi:hypothetical protein